MNKLLKIGLPVLVAMLLLVLGTGVVMAQGKDTPPPTNISVAADGGGSICPQGCQGNCNGVCPYAGNCNGQCGYQGGASRQGSGCAGGCGGYGNRGSQSQCHGGG